MGMGRMSIWVRDTAHPCLPYQSSTHSFFVAILSCDLQPLHFGAVHNGLFALTDVGKGGGRVHGQVAVPPGCYLVVGAATCKNVLTDMTMVEVRCDEEVCVNLITKSLSTCTGQILWALDIAHALGPDYSASSPAGREIPKEVIAKARQGLEELLKHIAKDTVTPALPFTVERLLELQAKADKGEKG